MQVEHKTERGMLTFFLPPSGADRFKYFNDEKPYLSYFVGAETFREYFPPGTVLIGLTSEVTEEQAKMMVDCVNNFNNSGNPAFIDYNESHLYTGKFWSALLSFKSLMQFKKVYEVNPIDKPNYNYKIDEQHSPSYVEEESYKEAQQTTGTWLTLFKPND